jgi:hypothetical protein
MLSHRSSKLAVVLLTSAALVVMGFTGDAVAANRGGGGGGGHAGGGHAGGVGHFGGGGQIGGGGHFGGGHAAMAHSFAGRAVTSHALTSRAATAHTFNRAATTSNLNGTGAVRSNGFAHTNVRNGLGAHNAVNDANRVNANNATANARFAHNQIAGRNFHGLYNFHRAGFNRNAFGNGHTWDRWGGRFWGAGWDNWGGGWGGWAGPVFWPYLYGDVFSFAFWPGGYYDPFFAFGPDFVLASIFAPGPYFGPDYYGYDNQSDVYYGASAADQRATARTDAAAAQSCNGLAPGVTDLPIAQISKTVQPAGDQLADLNALSEAASKANSIVAGSCPNSIPLTPVARLDAAGQRLNTMIQAIDVVRDPLGKFYDSLSDEQRQKFDDMSSANTGARETAPQDLASLCGPQPGDVTALPVQRIQQVVQPDAQQQGAFDDLKKVSEDIAAKLQGSCPAQMPKTPVARLDAVKTRLTAMVDAIDSVRPKLETFYASLSDEQKAKFNTMGPPKSAAADSPGQTSAQ